MKSLLLSALCLSVLAVSNALQIGAPNPGSVLREEETFTVQVIHNASAGDGNVVLIELTHEDAATGTVLYDGPYTPVTQAGSTYPYQNFTVQVPARFAVGPAQLSVSPLNNPPGIELGPTVSIDVNIVNI